MKKNKYTLTIGKNHKDLKKQVLDDDEIYDIISINLNKEGIDCFTSIDCVGAFVHKDNTKVLEKSIQIVVVDENDIKDKILKVIDSLKSGLSQESIMFQIEENQDISFL